MAYFFALIVLYSTSPQTSHFVGMDRTPRGHGVQGVVDSSWSRRPGCGGLLVVTASRVWWTPRGQGVHGVVDSSWSGRQGVVDSSWSGRPGFGGLLVVRASRV